MEKELPSVWKHERAGVLLFWGMFGLMGAFMAWTLHRDGGSLLNVLGTLLLFLGFAAAISIVLLQAGWRIHRVMRTFQDAIPGPTDGHVEEGRMKLTWRDHPVEVSGSTRFGNVWNLRAFTDDRTWVVPPWAADVVAREVRSEVLDPNQVETAERRDVPWGILRFINLATALLGGMLLAVVPMLLGSDAWALRMAIVGTLLTATTILWGRIKTRPMVAELVETLNEQGLGVDGPHLARASLAPRYVLFTPQGAVSVQVIALGPLVKFIATWGDVNVHIRHPDVHELARTIHTTLGDVEWSDRSERDRCDQAHPDWRVEHSRDGGLSVGLPM